MSQPVPDLWIRQTSYGVEIHGAHPTDQELSEPLTTMSPSSFQAIFRRPAPPRGMWFPATVSLSLGSWRPVMPAEW